MNDAISRQAAIEAIAKQTIYSPYLIKEHCKAFVSDENGWLGGLKDAIEAIEDLPSAQQKIKLGDAVRVVMEFLYTCSGGTASIKTPDGVELNTDWGYVYEGLDLLKEYAERKTDE